MDAQRKVTLDLLTIFLVLLWLLIVYGGTTINPLVIYWPFPDKDTFLAVMCPLACFITVGAVWFSFRSARRR